MTCQKSALQRSRHVIVLWAPTFALQCCGRPQTPNPDEHGKTPCMPLGINSVVGADVCHTRRRQHNLPRVSDIQQYCAAYHLVPIDVGSKTSSERTPSLSLIRPSPSSIKGDVLSSNRGIDQVH